ncbi:MAG: hypothetical protein WCF67_24565 [Chitinophagaceae bacterium]
MRLLLTFAGLHTKNWLPLHQSDARCRDLDGEKEKRKMDSEGEGLGVFSGGKLIKKTIAKQPPVKILCLIKLFFDIDEFVSFKNG